jgi:hypothetical protein
MQKRPPMNDTFMTAAKSLQMVSGKSEDMGWRLSLTAQRIITEPPGWLRLPGHVRRAPWRRYSHTLVVAETEWESRTSVLQAAIGLKFVGNGR